MFYILASAPITTSLGGLAGGLFPPDNCNQAIILYFALLLAIHDKLRHRHFFRTYLHNKCATWTILSSFNTNPGSIPPTFQHEMRIKFTRSLWPNLASHPSPTSLARFIQIFCSTIYITRNSPFLWTGPAANEYVWRSLNVFLFYVLTCPQHWFDMQFSCLAEYPLSTRTSDDATDHTILAS